MTTLLRGLEYLLKYWFYRRDISAFNYLKIHFVTHFLPKGNVYRIRLKQFAQPITVRARTPDCGVLWSILVRDGGEYPVFRGYHPQFIIDAGANIGMATLFFKRYYPEATIVAIEPDAKNCELFRRNTGHCTNVHLIQAGLGPDEKCYFRIKNESGEAHSFQLEKATSGIPEVTVDEICTTFGHPEIDIIKIDIEGGETELFARNISWVARTANIFVELHDGSAPGASQNLLSAVRGEYVLRSKGENYILSREYREIVN